MKRKSRYFQLPGIFLEVRECLLKHPLEVGFFGYSFFFGENCVIHFFLIQLQARGCQFRSFYISSNLMNHILDRKRNSFTKKKQFFETINFAFMKIFGFLVKIAIFEAFLYFLGGLRHALQVHSNT